MKKMRPLKERRFEMDNDAVIMQLENMYPETYKIIKPHCEQACDNIQANFGQQFVPNKAQLDNMVQDIYNKVEPVVEQTVNANMPNRQFFGSGRRLLRDLIAVTLITSLIRRRRPFFGGFYGYPGYGMFPGYGFPGYY